MTGVNLRLLLMTRNYRKVVVKSDINSNLFHTTQRIKSESVPIVKIMGNKEMHGETNQAYISDFLSCALTTIYDKLRIRDRNLISTSAICQR